VQAQAHCRIDSAGTSEEWVIMAASLTTVPGGTVDFSDEQLVELGMLFRGQIVGPGDLSYEGIRAVENLAIDRRPGLIIRCSGDADVIDGVNLARDHGLLLAIRAGGHHVAGHGTVDGGLVNAALGTSIDA
jgi:hypothetical protein